VSASGIDRVLIVCTANQCRSALGGMILVDRLRELELDVAVDSAGTHAVPGAGATPPTVTAAAALGLDLSAHESRLADAELVAAADLVLTMERAHVREMVVTDPQAFGRTFTLKEFVRRGAEIGPRPAEAPGTDWLARLNEDRRPVDLLGVSTDDDIGDPTSDRMLDHDSTAREIAELLVQVVDLVWPELPAPDIDCS
jgi:protein-tyrosine-phosphatase